MKPIKTNGITNLNSFDGCQEWYWGTDYSCGDLYEAEEVFLMGHSFIPNRLVFVHYPEGQVYEPICAGENQYLGVPAFVDGVIYGLLADFKERKIYILKCSEDMKSVEPEVTLSLDNVQDCYNLLLKGSPLMLTRQGADNRFQIIWPEKADFSIGVRESFLFREDDKLFFSEWQEDETYWEEVNIREISTGKLLEKLSGTEMTMPDGQKWLLK